MSDQDSEPQKSNKPVFNDKTQARKAEENARKAEALRANLHRRKAQKRSRDDESSQ